ncbi:MAG: hypothetical protein LBG24_06590 [Treponema sp.]|nr:hypothetical protein [Treponema sp.]
MSSESKKAGVGEVRLACRQFAMLYFHFCKVLVESLGEDKALPLVQRKTGPGNSRRCGIRLSARRPASLEECD